MARLKAFGELVAEERKKNQKDTTQRWLAITATAKHTNTVAASTISRIEQGAVPISEALGIAIIKALKPSRSKERELRAALKVYIQKFQAKKGNKAKVYESGKVLDEIMRGIGENGLADAELAKELSEKLNRPLSYQAVQQWRGIRLMSDEMLVAVSKELKKRGATPEQLRKLKCRHVYDVLMDMQRLNYLDRTQREKLAKYGARLV
ncbi:MAG TPA: hypothetical protein VFA15_02975 [Nitrososphaera sp.]|nr:hypothetical protein [Nitrososphaera sp.]